MMDNPQMIFVGLSATPWAKGLGKVYDDLVIGATLGELIDAGYLSKFRCFAPSHPDLSGVKIVAGEYNQGQLGEVMGERKLVADVVSTWLERGEGRPTLCFAVDRAHAAKLQRDFEAAGVRAGYVDAYTDVVEREAIKRKFEAGEIRVVCNCRTLTTGVDWAVGCIIDAAPTKSEMLHVQRVGRGLRVNPGIEDCIVLDHSDNNLRLGLVTDIAHAALDGGLQAQLAKKRVKVALPKECPSCAFLKPAKVHVCPSCGFKPEKISAVEVEDGKLVEITSGKKGFTRAEKQAWWSALMTVAAERGRARGWAAHTFQEKFGCWPRGLDDTSGAVPDAVMGYVKSKDIRWVKGRKNAAGG